MSSRPTERFSKLAVANVSETTATAIRTAGVLKRDFQQFSGYCANGATSAEAVTVKLLSAKTAAAGETDTALIASASCDSNAQVLLNYNAGETDTARLYIGISATPADTSAGTFAYLEIVGSEPRNAPASDRDASTIAVTNL